MNTKDLAKNLIDFFDKVPGYWDQLKMAIVDQLAIIAKQVEADLKVIIERDAEPVAAKARELLRKLLSDKVVFFDTLAEMILYAKKTPKAFRGFFKWIMMLVFTKLIIPFMDKKLGETWLSTVRKRMEAFQIADTGIKRIA